MTYSSSLGQTSTDPILAAEPQATPVDLFVDGHHVAGELRYNGPPRRLVDLLNTIEGDSVWLFDGHVGLAAKAAVRHFDVAQLRRDAIIYAVPRSGGPRPGASMDSVQKKPTPVSVLLPGCEITGQFHLILGADPTTMPVLTTRHFVVMTDAVIHPADSDEPSQEALVVVNLARALFYAPHAAGA